MGLCVGSICRVGVLLDFALALHLLLHSYIEISVPSFSLSLATVKIYIANIKLREESLLRDRQKSETLITL